MAKAKDNRNMGTYRVTLIDNVDARDESARDDMRERMVERIEAALNPLIADGFTVKVERA